MKTRYNYLIVILFLLLSMEYLSAQGRFGITYNMALPMGESADLVGKYSFRGAGLEARWEVADVLYLGFNASWNVFYESEKGTFTEGNRTLTGTQYRYINAIPLMATVYKGFITPGGVSPYAGLGIGAIKALQERDMGLWYVEENNWHFGLAPEVGLLFNPGIGFDILLSVRYNYGFKVKDAPSVSYLGINIGFLI
jgi:opacity protein-like surface antigen